MTIIKNINAAVSRVTKAPQLRVKLRRVQHSASPGFSGSIDTTRLVAQRLRWGSNGQLSYLRLKWIGGSSPDDFLSSQQQDLPAMGDEITLIDSFDASPWFIGHIGQHGLLIQSGPDAQQRDICAYGPELRLKGRAIHGRWCKLAGADNMLLNGQLTSASASADLLFDSDLPVIFNADGRPNCSASAINWQLCERRAASSHNSARVFESPAHTAGPLAAEFWTPAAALRSLVERVDQYSIISPETDWRRIASVLDASTLGELSVEGTNLLDAIWQIVRRCGCGFCLVPWSDGRSYSDGLSRHVLHVFPRGGDRVGIGGPILGDGTGSDVHVRRMELLSDGHNSVNTVRVVGALKRVDVQLDFTGDTASDDLICAWDTSAHALSDYAHNGRVADMELASVGSSIDTEEFLSRYCRSGAENIDNFHVFRSFIWNEDASITPSSGEFKDLSATLGNNYTHRPRPLGPPVDLPQEDISAAAKCAYVMLGVAGDEDSWILLAGAELMKDRAGFTINIDRLDSYYPYARATAELRSRYASGANRYSLATLIMNALEPSVNPGGPAARFKLIGSVESDTSISEKAFTMAPGSWPLTSEKVVYDPLRYRLDTGSDLFGTPLRDDSDSAATYAASLSEALARPIDHGSLVLHGLHRCYRPGQALSKTRGREISLSLSRDGDEANVCVNSVSWSFDERAARTEILLETPALEVYR